MSIRNSWNNLYNQIKGLCSHEYYDASNGINIPMELVTPQWKKPDSIGNEISPGDLVSCDGTSGYRAEVGILLGWTENGYRVAPFCTNSKVEHNRIIKSTLISPNVVFLVKRKNSTVLE